MADIITDDSGPLAISEIVGGVTVVYTSENSANAQRYAAAAAASAASASTSAGLAAGGIRGRTRTFTVTGTKYPVNGRVARDGRFLSIQLASGTLTTLGRTQADMIAATVRRSFTMATTPPTGRVSRDGRFVEVQRAAEPQIAPWLDQRAMVAALNTPVAPLPVRDAMRPVFSSSSLSGVPVDSSPIYRIPCIYKIQEPASTLGSVPRTRLLMMCDGRPNGDIDADPSNFCSFKTSDDDGATWSAERVIFIGDGTSRITHGNRLAGFDPATGRLQIVFCSFPYGYLETTVPAPNNAGGSAGRHVKVYSCYVVDPFAALSAWVFKDQAGTTMTIPAYPQAATEETSARDGVTPNWFVSPTCPTINTWDGKIVGCGWGAGTAGGVGLGTNLTAFSYLLTFNGAAAAGSMWSWSMATPLALNFSEATIVELRSGAILLDARDIGSANYYRRVAISDPARTKWARAYIDTQRADSHCAGAMARISGGYGKQDVSVIVSATLDEPALRQGANRRRLTVFAAVDNGDDRIDWTWKLRLHPDSFTATKDILGGTLGTPVTVNPALTAYPTLAALARNEMLLAVESFVVQPSGAVAVSFGSIVGHKINLASITKGLLP